MTSPTVKAIESVSDQFVRHLDPPVVTVGSDLEVAPFDATKGLNDLHKVTGIDGIAPTRAVLLKTFKGATGGQRDMIERITSLHDSFGSAGLDPGWPDDFLAFPYQMFRFERDGVEELGILMLDMMSLGFGLPPFGNARKEVQARVNGDYEQVQLPERIRIVMSMLEKVEMMHAAGWTHADLNPPNMLIRGSEIQLIDFDAGTRDGSGRAPLVGGKDDPFTPQEIFREPLPAGQGWDLSRLDRQAEKWSVGVLVGCLLFGGLVACFLKHLTPLTVEAYAASGHNWPDFDPSETHIADEPMLLQQHAAIVERVTNFTPGLAPLYVRFFRAGLDGSQRPDTAEWHQALGQLLQPLTVERLEVDEDLVFEGDRVEVEWDVRGADWVKVANVDQLPARGATRIAFTRTTQVELLAGNSTGTIRCLGPVVRVLPLPAVETIQVPAGPQLPAPPFGRPGLPVPEFGASPKDRPPALPSLAASVRFEAPSPDEEMPEIPWFDTSLIFRGRW